MIVKDAEPFFYPGNSTGCLLIHGFTGAPTEMRPVGEHLAGEGYSVLGVRLAGHGTRVEDMNRMHWIDWSNSVLDGWNLLRPITKEIFLIGLSMGGVLALYHSSFLPVQGVVSLATPYKIEKSPLVKLVRYLTWLIPIISKGKDDWQDPTAGDEHFSYDKYPTKAALQLQDLLEEMVNSLPEIKVPALVMGSTKDETAPPEHIDFIFNHLGTEQAQKQKVFVSNSGHVITRDQDKEAVFDQISKFIATYRSSSS
jgi:carboxylesterase